MARITQYLQNEPQERISLLTEPDWGIKADVILVEELDQRAHAFLRALAPRLPPKYTTQTVLCNEGRHTCESIILAS